MLVDLDNTLVDRRAAFDTWASAFIREVNGSVVDQAWLLEEDADGYRPRAAPARAVINRFGLSSSCEQLVERMLHEYVELIRPFPGVLSRLGGARRQRGTDPGRDQRDRDSADSEAGTHEPAPARRRGGDLRGGRGQEA